MNARRVTAVARKEFLHVLRDPRSLGMAIAIPMLMLLLFGFALTLDVDHVPLVVWDQSGTPDSRELVSQFAGSPYFSLVRVTSITSRDMNRAIDSGEALMGLVIPYDFARRLASRTEDAAGSGHFGRGLEHGHDRPGLCRRNRGDLLAGVDDSPLSAARARRKSKCRWMSAAGSGSTPTWSRRTTSCRG